MSSSLRYLSPPYLSTGCSLLLACRAARRLLSGSQPSLPPVPASPEPYNHQLLRRVRRLARATGKLVAGRQEGPAVGTVAAFVLLRRTGWPIALEVGGPDGRLSACVRLWGEPILGGLPTGAEADRVMSSGPDVAAADPRAPALECGVVSQVACEGALGDSLRGALEPLGGISSVVAPGQSVLLKPNFNSYHPSPASTSFDLLSCMVDLLREAGAAQVAVGECSAIALSPTRNVARRAGLLRWAEAHDVELILFDEQPWRVCPIPGRRYRRIIVPECLKRFDRLIYLASAKTHRHAGVSLSLKLGVGMMHPVQRIALHDDQLLERISEIALAVRPDLALIDARRCFVSGGPDVGEVQEPGVILASADLEALDEAAMALLAEYGASGLEAGRRQVRAAGEARLRASAGAGDRPPVVE